jgi:hypothetical protein
LGKTSDTPITEGKVGFEFGGEDGHLRGQEWFAQGFLAVVIGHDLGKLAEVFSDRLPK